MRHLLLVLALLLTACPPSSPRMATQETTP